MNKTFFKITFIILPFYCQSQIIPDSLGSRVTAYINKFPQEKIYLHLDRTNYSPGDTIWFKAYITDAVAHLTDTVSKNIYVDLYKKDTGIKISSLLLHNEDGFANGQISLPDVLLEGVYEIRSYTNWMRNFDDEYFFHKEIYLRKRYETKIAPSEKEINDYIKIADLQFFPEGGNLIVGLQNRIAFKAVNKYGYGIDFKGFIISSRYDTVAWLRSQHLGMGNFILKPQAGETYYAVPEKQINKTQYFLPGSLPQGYTFFVDNLTNKEKIKVTARHNFSTKDRPTLVVHQRGTIVAVLPSSAEGNSFAWSINKGDIPADGIVHFTLFSVDGAPQCERIVYNDAKSPLQIFVVPDKDSYKPHEKVSLSIQVKNSEGEPAQGNFSLAVTDKQQAIDTDGTNISTYFNLTSDIQSLYKETKGNIEQPQYYFDESNAMARIDLDVLLMTQGWRRFVWSDILATQQWHTTHEIETGIDLKGKALTLEKKAFKKSLDITLFYMNKGMPVYGKTQTDATGNFVFKNVDAGNGTKLTILGDNKNRKYMTIEIDSSRNNEATYHSNDAVFDPFFLNKQDVDQYIKQQYKFADLDAELKRNTEVLKEVVVTAKKEPKVNDTRKAYYEGTNFQAVKIDQTMCGSAQNVLQMLQGRVAGLTISANGGGYTPLLARGSSFMAPAIPIILVDGIVTDLQFVSNIVPCTVESIEVVTHAVVTLNAQGVISILTKRADPNYDWSKDKTEGTAHIVFKGYDVSREFYSPKYDVAPSKKLPDYRATLYWNPNIKTDAQGNAKVTFWNSDEITSVHAQLEGISNDGQTGAATIEYNVE